MMSARKLLKVETKMVVREKAKSLQVMRADGMLVPFRLS